MRRDLLTAPEDVAFGFAVIDRRYGFATVTAGSRCRAAKLMIRSRWNAVDGLDVTTVPPFGPCVNAEIRSTFCAKMSANCSLALHRTEDRGGLLRAPEHFA